MKIKSFFRKNLKLFIGIIIGLIISGTGVYAATIIFNSNQVGYDNTSSGMTSTNVQDALDELYTKCTVSSPFKVGDWVSMTPTTTSFTTDTNMTGYNNAQTITPSELNLWRVIKINKDGTVDMVSKYASSNYINFDNVIGYKNYTGYLNVIASHYGNSKYTVRTRSLGYNGQTEFITDTSAFDGTSNNPAWTCSSRSSDCVTDETRGGGDNLYLSDVELIREVFGTLKTTVYGTSGDARLFLTSRIYYYSNNSFYYYEALYNPYSDDLYDTSGASGALVYYNGSSWDHYGGASGGHMRPIVTLRETVVPASGAGTEASPYVLP